MVRIQRRRQRDDDDDEEGKEAGGGCISRFDDGSKGRRSKNGREVDIGEITDEERGETRE